MAKDKRLIEKVWWVIPPVFVFFVTVPFVFIFLEMSKFNFGLDSFVRLYVKNLSIFSYMVSDDPTGNGALVFTIGFMALGYYLSRKKTLLMCLALPIVLGTIGFFVGILATWIIGCGLFGGCT
jgi:hypothetical protein